MELILPERLFMSEELSGGLMVPGLLRYYGLRGLGGEYRDRNPGFHETKENFERAVTEISMGTTSSREAVSMSLRKILRGATDKLDFEPEWEKILGNLILSYKRKS